VTRASERFLRRRIEDEDYWLDLEAGEFYAVNDAGVAILEAWKEGVRQPSALAERLAGAFEVTREEALAAVEAFLPEARSRGMLGE
jgi:hypothetical protein